MKIIQIKTTHSDTESLQCEAIWQLHKLEQAHAIRSTAITMRVFASKTAYAHFSIGFCYAHVLISPLSHSISYESG